MKKVSINIKRLVFVVAIILILYAVIIVILRPLMENIEQNRTITKIEQPEPIIVYVQILVDIKDNSSSATIFKKNELAILKVRPNKLNCVIYNSASCFPEKSYRILNTDTDQELIKKAIGSEYGTAFHKDSTIANFEDINKDGIKDAFIYQISEPASSIGLEDYTVYSATDNKILWGVSKTIFFNDLANTQNEIRIVSAPSKPDMIVIFEAKKFEIDRYNRYYFYKYQNNQYLQVKPTNEDWKSYWRTISSVNLFLTKFIDSNIL